ncbi:MAG: GvpL/GvpF family gas vesicle protein [Acidobacteria bacterium]|nr:GvpL/GvpF family gas vesicle protein [Acidobacteriota bacterium]
MLYLYCLSDEATARVLDGAAGIGGVAPHLFDCAGICAVVSEFASATVAVTRENVLAHERVLSRVLAATTPLPFRFGTVAGEERLENFVSTHRASLLSALARVRGAVEMSVKIIWDEEPERAAPDSEAQEAGAGTRFLLTKRRELLGAERLQERAENLSAWLAHMLEENVKDSLVEVRPAASLVVSASHLVAREAVESYRARLEAARRERPDLRFLTSGPWPPYSFSNLFP